MIKTIIFDVDGTLLDTEKIYMKAWAEAAKARGFEIPQEALLKTRAVNAKVAKATFQEYCGEDFPYDLLRTERVSIAEQMIAVLFDIVHVFLHVDFIDLTPGGDLHPLIVDGKNCNIVAPYY